MTYVKKGMTATVTCAICGKEAARTGAMQKYCPDCSREHGQLRQNAWARAHPPSPAVMAKQALAGRVETLEVKVVGAEVSAENRTAISWYGDGPDLRWSVRVAVPFSYAVSKNHIYAIREQGHVVLRKESNDWKATLRDTLALAIREHPVIQAKLWLDIFVQKSDHKGDAVNVVDLVCDAVKEATGLDDRWYSIRRLDWEIVKIDPKIYVGIGQDTDEPYQHCSSCGQPLPFSAFPKGNTPNRTSRWCRGCLHLARLRRKGAKGGQPSIE